MKALLEYLYFLAQYLSEADVETITAIFLIDLGFHAGKQSCEYIKTSVLRYSTKPKQLLTYELYLDVGKHHGMNTAKQVEITMRRELRRRWKE